MSEYLLDPLELESMPLSYQLFYDFYKYLEFYEHPKLENGGYLHAKTIEAMLDIYRETKSANLENQLKEDLMDLLKACYKKE